MTNALVLLSTFLTTNEVVVTRSPSNTVERAAIVATLRKRHPTVPMSSIKAVLPWAEQIEVSRRKVIKTNDVYGFVVGPTNAPVHVPVATVQRP